MLERRRALDPIQRAGWSVAIQRRVIDLPSFAASRTVALYAPLGGEPDTRALWEAASRAGKRVMLPGLGAQEQPEFRPAGRPEALSVGQLGFQEPARGESVPAVEIDLFLAPGLAFDRQGHRLGRGKGFYDRLLAGRRPDSTTVGITFEAVLVDQLVSEPHDVVMDFVVTEAALYTARRTSPANTLASN
jgi:5-formyltetrahydrofolate cyclo-ligase